jgi:hypothetical protein
MAACLVAGFLLMSLILNYQAMLPRVELPLFTMSCVCIPLMLPIGRDWVAAAVAAFNIAYAAPYVLDNHRRPAFGPRSVFTTYRPMQYFRDFPELFPDYAELVPMLRSKSYRSLGLQTHEHQLHYPLWPMVKARHLRGTEVREVNVTNVSAKLAPVWSPEAVLVTYPMEEETLEVGGVGYRRVWRGRSISLFEKAPRP